MTTANCGFPDGNSLVQFGPTIDVQVGFDPGFQPGSNGRPTLPPTLWPGLVDTGAGECCIDSVLAQRFNLPIVDRIQISGVGGPMLVNKHLAQLYIPSLNYTIYGTFAGVYLTAGGQPHQVLIGRTALQGIRMEYKGQTGEVSLIL